ncbi:MAG: UDP-3-O-acyl-N-acetylglucosamine deacetylase [Thermodesulfobacteriota bacterium]
MASPSLDPHQHTLKKSVSCYGVGLHSGNIVNLTIKPAPDDSGIHFYRTDLDGKNGVPAHMDKIVDTRLATTIAEENVQISTTEHLMAALQGYGVDNANIELDGPEVPIMDGSAGPFMLLLKRAGLKKQKSRRKVLRITKEIRFTTGDTEIKILPYEGFKVSGEIQFDDALIKTQSYTIDISAEKFSKEISQARTFGYVEQVEELWANGLAQGGTLDNVIAIHWDRSSILNDGGLRFADEFIRHKVLDLIGDLALLGCPILGHVIAKRSGHTQHLAFMQAVAQATDCWEIVEMKKNGKHSVFQQVASSTRAVGEQIIPFFVPQPSHQTPAVARVSC